MKKHNTYNVELMDNISKGNISDTYNVELMGNVSNTNIGNAYIIELEYKLERIFLPGGKLSLDNNLTCDIKLLQ